MDLKAERRKVGIVIAVIITLGACQSLLALDGYHLIYGGFFAALLIFLFFAFVCYLAFIINDKIKKSCILSVAIIMVCFFGLIIALLFLSLVGPYDYSPYRTFSDPKSGNAIIIYEQPGFTWLEDSKYELGVVKCFVFIDTLTHKKPEVYTGNLFLKELNPQIIWTKDTATVCMPNGEIMMVEFKR